MTSAIAEFRKDKGLTLEAFGEPLSVTKTSVLRWEEIGVPAERVVEIEAQWGIPREKLRPDLFRSKKGRAA